jgi:ubiquinone/menaquinone biosynthesis C-methylase UbiE
MTTWGEYYHAIASRMALYTESNRSLAEAADLRPGLKVVDLACGSGLTSLAALEAVPAGLDLTLLDSDPSMVAAARTHVGARATCHVADALDIAAHVPDKVDRVLCNLAFFSFRDPEAVLREVRKVLKPTGRIVFSLLNTYFNINGTLVSPQWALLRHLHAAGRIARGVNDVDRLPNQRSIEGTLSGAGYKPFFYKATAIESTVPDWEPGGELYQQLDLYPVFGGADGPKQSHAALQEATPAIAALPVGWRVVVFAAQPQLGAEEAFRLRFGGKLPGEQP